MSIFTNFTQDAITEHFKSSTLCVLTLINSDVIICNAKEFDDKVILFNPVLVEGYIDENQVFQYFFKPICVASKDNFTVIDNNKILFANTIDIGFKNDYIEFQKLKIQKQIEDKTSEKYDNNVIELNKGTIH